MTNFSVCSLMYIMSYDGMLHTVTVLQNGGENSLLEIAYSNWHSEHLYRNSRNALPFIMEKKQSL